MPNNEIGERAEATHARLSTVHASAHESIVTVLLEAWRSLAGQFIGFCKPDQLIVRIGQEAQLRGRGVRVPLRDWLPTTRLRGSRR